jgi:ring-1,2-phenylacetyl-CoA epoxidase subunit PaaC
MELDGGDFGRTMARQLLVAAWQLPLYEALRTSTDEGVAGVAGKAVKEVAYHLDHARSWVVRLGDGTAESHRRVQAGADAVWPLLADVFSPTEVEQRLTAAGVAVDPSSTRAEVVGVLTQVLEQATLTVPAWPADALPRGRLGIHDEELSLLLADLQGLARQHPAATW